MTAYEGHTASLQRQIITNQANELAGAHDTIRTLTAALEDSETRCAATQDALDRAEGELRDLRAAAGVTK